MERLDGNSRESDARAFKTPNGAFHHLRLSSATRPLKAVTMVCVYSGVKISLWLRVRWANQGRPR
jgi:hypothetical protein